MGSVSLPFSVLIVEDDNSERRYLDLILKNEGYRTEFASDGQQALDFVREQRPDMVILDVLLPLYSGFEVARILKEDPQTRPIPILMLTVLDDTASRMEGLNAGVEEFLHKPVDPMELLIRVRNLLKMKEYAELLSRRNRDLERKVKERTAQLSLSYRQSVHALIRVTSLKDVSVGDHVRRISLFAEHLSRSIGMDDHFSETIHMAAALHDIGKIGVPDEVLLKEGPLNDREWAIMQEHVRIGGVILGFSPEAPAVEMGREIALAHHENFDGTGYPLSLKGEEIPLSARIVKICDVYDTLRAKRPYKSAYAHEDALRRISEGDERTRPEHFDPHILASFLAEETFYRDTFRRLENTPLI
jgi:putative two-component system response regulator